VGAERSPHHQTHRQHTPHHTTPTPHPPPPPPPTATRRAVKKSSLLDRPLLGAKLFPRFLERSCRSLIDLLIFPKSKANWVRVFLPSNFFDPTPTTNPPTAMSPSYCRLEPFERLLPANTSLRRAVSWSGEGCLPFDRKLPESHFVSLYSCPSLGVLFFYNGLRACHCERDCPQNNWNVTLFLFLCRCTP